MTKCFVGLECFVHSCFLFSAAIASSQGGKSGNNSPSFRSPSVRTSTSSSLCLSEMKIFLLRLRVAVPASVQQWGPRAQSPANSLRKSGDDCDDRNALNVNTARGRGEGRERKSASGKICSPKSIPAVSACLRHFHARVRVCEKD